METIGSFIYHYVELPPARQMPLHTQPSWELSFVVRGCGHRQIGEDRAHFRRGDLVLVPPGMSHCWYFTAADVDASGCIANISLMFTTRLLDALAELFADTAPSLRRLAGLTDAIAFSPEVSASMGETLMGMRTLPDPERVGDVVSLLSRIARGLDDSRVVGSSPEASSGSKRLRQIEIFVACNYMRPIGVGDVAQLLGMNKTSFCSFFRRATGTTFVSHLNDYRLRQARWLLSQRGPGETVADICYRVGFQTPSHFNHLFRRKYGCAPLEVWKNLRRGCRFFRRKCLTLHRHYESKRLTNAFSMT